MLPSLRVFAAVKLMFLVLTVCLAGVVEAVFLPRQNDPARTFSTILQENPVISCKILQEQELSRILQDTCKSLVISCRLLLDLAGSFLLGWHAAVIETIRHALVSGGVPAVLEPVGVCRDDGKRPDGMSLIPWSWGVLREKSCARFASLQARFLHGKQDSYK